ncbi:hypothetical protein TrVE_jg11415 [Triparma verrucosa]|nr:hypothetical protein TrVE_jg11415 [Triparma verrucosa]
MGPAVTGTVTISGRFFNMAEEGGVDEESAHKDKGDWLFLEVESCQGLAKADAFGGSDSFVIIRAKNAEFDLDREVCRTSVVEDSLDPIWYDDCYELPPPEDKNGFELKKTTFQLEVWDSDSIKVGEFLGKSQFQGDIFTKQADLQTFTFPLQGGELEHNPPSVYNSSQYEAQGLKVPQPNPTRRSKGPTDHEKELETSNAATFLSIGVIMGYIFIGVVAFGFIFEDWTVIDCMYYAVLTFTTVGYGDFALESDDWASQLFNSFYAILGISIIGWALNVIGQKMVQEQVKALAAANKKASRPVVDNFEPSEHDTEAQIEEKLVKKLEKEAEDNAAAMRERWKKIKKNVWPIVAMFTIGSVVFGLLEGWTVIQSFYWCVITSLSIGYGDFAPAKQSSRLLAVLFIPLSVAIVSGCIGGIVNVFIEEEIKRTNARLLSRELTVEDLDEINKDGGEGVDRLEFVEFMLKAMQKVDQSLLNQLHAQFDKIDEDGSGHLQKEDLELAAKKKLAMRRKMKLASKKVGSTVIFTKKGASRASVMKALKTSSDAKIATTGADRIPNTGQAQGAKS